MTTTVITVARQKIREQASDRTVLFARSYAQGVRQLDRLTRQGVTRINRLLNELRVDIRGKLAQLTGGLDDPFTARIVPTIAEEINESLAAFTTAANGELGASLASAFDLGAGITSQALNAIGLPLAAPIVSPQLLAALTGTTQDVMTEMVGRLGQRIMGQVRLAAVGLEPASAAINSIDNILRTSEAVRRGVRRRIGFGFQAEAIVRTEVGRVYSAAQQAAGEQIAESIPDLKKRWVTRSKKRKGHLAVERQTAVGGPDGPIPIKQRFRVSDFSRIGTTSFLTLGKRIQPPQGSIPGQRVVKTKTFRRRGRIITDRMLFPRDPGASAGNVVNCTCVVVEFLPEIEAAVERTMGVIQRGGEPAPPPPVEKRKDVDRKGRIIERTKDPTTDRWKKWSGALTKGDRSTINDWSFNGYISMRNVQLGRFTGSAVAKKEIQKKLRALTKAVKTAPVWEGEVFRGIKDVPPAVFKKWKRAKTWKFNAFSSTSTKRSVAVDFIVSGTKNQVLLRIKSGTGVWLRPLSGLPGEFEVLYEKGQKFRVVNRTLKKVLDVEQLILDLEEIT